MKWYNFIFVLLAFVFFVGCTQPQTIVVGKEDAKDINTLTVQGVAEFDTAPDEAIISFAIETQDMDVKVAQDENRKRANSVMQALALIGVTEDQIETTYYNIQKVREWEPKTRKQIDKGYRVSNTMKVTLNDLNKVGEVTDAVVKAGVNRVNDINFQLSSKKQAEVKAEALRLAAENAKIKADALALGAGVTLGKITSVQEEMFEYYPTRVYAEKAVMAGGMDEEYMPPTPISPEQVHIQVKVKVVYSI